MIRLTNLCRSIALVFMVAVLWSCAEPVMGPQRDTSTGWSPRTYACPDVSTLQPIQIDGKLDDAAWSAAPWTASFVDIEGARRPAPWHDTRVKMMWDETFIYFGADMVETDLWATYTKRDSIIYHEND
ncbi:MAG: carbohydrate-binding family 9-like protein, partial [Planctomycetota bacterium]